jgi:ATP-dependent Clp protease ATP-binding subunit ClpX
MRRSDEADKSLRCSFCHKAQSDVGNLISNPSDYPRAFICDECILVCAAILEDNRPQPEAIESDPQAERNPLLDHPLAS